MATTHSTATKLCTFRLADDGIIEATMAEGARFELPDAVEAIEATCKVAGGRRRPVLVDMRGLRSETKEARDHFGGPSIAMCASAVGLLVGSPVSRMIANFFLRLGTQPIPTRVFADDRSARAWLRTHVAS